MSSALSGWPSTSQIAVRRKSERAGVHHTGGAADQYGSAKHQKLKYVQRSEADQTAARVTDIDQRLYRQYCISTDTFLLPGWLQLQARGYVDSESILASVPAVCGFIGGVLGLFPTGWCRTGSLNVRVNTDRDECCCVMVFCNRQR